MGKLQQYVRFIQEAENLKSVLRTAWSASGRHESTAEHSWRMALLAGIFLEEYPQLDGKKVLMMCLIHDMGELYGGDISATLRPDPDDKYREEFEAVQKVFGMLPEEQGGQLLELWSEYHDNSTPEAHLVKALDKAETIIQHNQGKNPQEFDYGFNLQYGAEYFWEDALLLELRSVLDTDTKAREKTAAAQRQEGGQRDEYEE